MDLSRIVSILSNEYGDPLLKNKRNPVDELIFAVLSERTDETKYVAAFRRLKANFPRWTSIHYAPTSMIKKLIGEAGMGTRRAALIKRILKTISTRFGVVGLSALRNLSAADAEHILCSLPGVGPKVARCVLLYCFHKPVLPVDIHTYRLAIRIGLLSRRISYDQSHAILPSLIPAVLRRRFHVNAVAHGRTRCFAENPRCDGCPLTEFCLHSKAEKPLRIEVRPRQLAMDLFCGAGGMSQGFKKAGFQIVQAIEANRYAANTYQINHPEIDSVESSIQELDPQKCLARLGLRPGDLTVLIGGPPCQGFSDSNRRTRNLSNPKNYLYKEFVRFLAALQPGWFVMENVAGLKTLDQGSILKRIITECKSLGYVVDSYVLNAADYGVPQFRRRLFIVGNRLGLSVPQPEPTHGPGKRPWITVRQAIADLPSLRNGAAEDYLVYPSLGERFFRKRLSHYQALMRTRVDGATKVQGNLVTNSAEKILGRYKHIKGGQNWEAIPDDLMDNYEDSTRCHTGIYHRLEWDEPAKVIGNFRKNMLIHPRQHRGLSVREAARLQSFPDDYVFLGSIGFQQQQVADAVPPLLAEAVAKAVKAADAKIILEFGPSKIEIAA
jgi:DNA (cytosine-5)-methyltransferase 1